MNLVDLLAHYGACDDSIKWAEGRVVGPKAWNECPNPMWLLWIAARIGVDPKLIALAVCDCIQLGDHVDEPAYVDLLDALREYCHAETTDGFGKLAFYITEAAAVHMSQDYTNDIRKALWVALEAASIVYRPENDSRVATRFQASYASIDVIDYLIDCAVLGATDTETRKIEQEMYEIFTETIRERLPWSTVEAAYTEEWGHVKEWKGN